jgi:hypothetical protein
MGFRRSGGATTWFNPFSSSNSTQKLICEKLETCISRHAYAPLHRTCICDILFPCTCSPVKSRDTCQSESDKGPSISPLHPQASLTQVQKYVLAGGGK